MMATSGKKSDHEATGGPKEKVPTAPPKKKKHPMLYQPTRVEQEGYRDLRRHWIWDLHSPTISAKNTMPTRGQTRNSGLSYPNQRNHFLLQKWGRYAVKLRKKMEDELLSVGSVPANSKCEAFLDRQGIPGGDQMCFPDLADCTLSEDFPNLSEWEVMEPPKRDKKRWHHSRDRCAAQSQGKGAFRG